MSEERLLRGTYTQNMLIEIREEHGESWEGDKERVLLLLSAKSLSISGCLGVAEAEMKWL
jgi:hypothetical protein